MKLIALLHNGVANITIAMVVLDGITMPQRMGVCSTNSENHASLHLLNLVNHLRTN